MNAIVSVGSNWAIGKNGKLLIPNREDMKYFVAHTINKTVIMGRKTLESFPDAKPLKNRRNIVISHNTSFNCEGVEIAHSIDEALLMVNDISVQDVWVIGGGSLYKQLLDLCEYCYVTYHLETADADTYFPNLDELPNWELTQESELHYTPSNIAFTFRIYKNKAFNI